MPDIRIDEWFNNLGTTIQPAFNTTAMGPNLTPADVIFGAAEAYRETQTIYNAGTDVSAGEFINFASPITEDPTPTIDAAGELSANRVITLRAKVVYNAAPGIAPQNSTVII